MSATPAALESEQRPPLARALRHWRQQRRISQLELALSCGVSQRHLSYLEVGRAQASREMVLRLGEALRIPLREQNHLLATAGFAPQFRESALGDAAMEPVFSALQMMLDHHEPYPALVVDWDWNLLRMNQAMQRILGLLGDAEALWQRTCGDGPRNVFRITMHPEGLRPFIRNWTELAPAVIARTRREAEHYCTPTLAELLQWVEQDPEIPADWTAASSAPIMPVIPLVMGAGEMSLSMFSMISTFGTPHDVTTDELRVETFFPADAASEALLRTLAASAAGP